MAVEKPVLKSILIDESHMSIRLCAEAGLLEVTADDLKETAAIDRNCGEIENKCWTEAS
jgi:hypothetical protein